MTAGLRAAILAWALVAACSRTATEARWPIDVAARHRQADTYLESGDRDAARRTLLALIDLLDKHRPEAGGSELRAALQDACFRLGILELEARNPRAALAAGDRGLELEGEPDLFTANLHVVRAAAREALGEDAAATEEYHRALLINERLLEGIMEPR